MTPKPRGFSVGRSPSSSAAGDCEDRLALETIPSLLERELDGRCHTTRSGARLCGDQTGSRCIDPADGPATEDIFGQTGLDGLAMPVLAASEPGAGAAFVRTMYIRIRTKDQPSTARAFEDARDQAFDDLSRESGRTDVAGQTVGSTSASAVVIRRGAPPVLEVCSIAPAAAPRGRAACDVTSPDDDRAGPGLVERCRAFVLLASVAVAAALFAGSASAPKPKTLVDPGGQRNNSTLKPAIGLLDAGPRTTAVNIFRLERAFASLS